jgi:hypothetical protein
LEDSAACTFAHVPDSQYFEVLGPDEFLANGKLKSIKIRHRDVSNEEDPFKFSTAHAKIRGGVRKWIEKSHLPTSHAGVLNFIEQE